MIVINKVCIYCNQDKKINEFHKNKNAKDEHSSVCKECNIKRVQEWRLNNLEKRNIYEKKYWSLHHDNYLLIRRKSKIKNQDKIKKQQKIWRFNNKHKIYIHYKTNKDIQKGSIEKTNYCSNCKKHSSFIHAHHPDYNDYLTVIWLCPSCHELLHNHIRKECESHSNNKIVGNTLSG